MEKYELETSEELLEGISMIEGDLEEIDLESVYKFIDTVSKLDLEKYAEQTKENEETKKITLEGRKEGLLYKYKGRAYLSFSKSPARISFVPIKSLHSSLVIMRLIFGFSNLK